MARFVLLTFAFLGWAWFEMSGGTDFNAGAPAPEAPILAATADAPVAQVARADTGASLTVITAPVADPDAAKLEIAVTSLQPTSSRAEPDVQKVASLAAPAIASDAVEIAVAEPVADIRAVMGARVNMRSGPGTNFAILDQLRRGAAVEVLEDPGEGWLQLRVVETDRIGWMADYLVTAAAE